MNALTVGALSVDAFDTDGGRFRDLVATSGLPSVISPVGTGVGRAVKPDILAPGGRQVYDDAPGAPDGQSRFTVRGVTGRPPGQGVAAAPAAPGERARVRYTCGTSNAAALVSRAASLIIDELSELAGQPGAGIVEDRHVPALAKALVVHGAHWDRDAYAALERALRTERNSRRFREYAARFLGYGALDLERAVECTAQRATLLAAGDLADDEADDFEVPLPPGLSGERVWRRLVVTLAWLSPTNPQHRRYRRAKLWFTPPDDELVVSRTDADWQAARRGTVQHEVLEGDAVSVYADDAALALRVNCTADAGNLDVPVRYGLAVTIEVAPETGINVYEQIRDRVRPLIPVRPPS